MSDDHRPAVFYQSKLGSLQLLSMGGGLAPLFIGQMTGRTPSQEGVSVCVCVLLCIWVLMRKRETT